MKVTPCSFILRCESPRETLSELVLSFDGPHMRNKPSSIPKTGRSAVCRLPSALPLYKNVGRKDNISERLNADVGCRQDNVQSFLSQRLDSCCFRGASNVRPWWTRSRQVVLLTANLVVVCSSVNTQIHAIYVDTSVRPLLMIYAFSLQWLKSKHWQERTANGFVMASWLNLTKSRFTSSF